MEEHTHIKHDHPEPILINEMQLLLAEKRTYLSELRTGTAVFTLPLSIVVFLIAARDYHTLFQDIVLSSVTIGILLLFDLLGLFLIYRSERKIRRVSRAVEDIKAGHKHLAELVI